MLHAPYIVYRSYTLSLLSSVIGLSHGTLHSVPLPSYEEVDVVVEDFQQPLILLWNPNITHNKIVEDRLKKCITCGSPYTMGYWNDGSSVSKQPRIIHTIDNLVLLVSAVYICENHHRLLAHDEAVLECFSIRCAIPFVLVHRTGFARDFVTMCTSLVRGGMNFYAIESLILERRWETFLREHSRFQLHQRITQSASCERRDLSSSPLSHCPSNNLLSTVFLNF